MDIIQKQNAAGAKKFHAGTLSYTMGGIVLLFFLLLAGDFVWSLRERSVTVITQLLLKKHGASDFLIGLYLYTLPGVLGLIVGPVISFRSDRHRGRWGRRIPYLLFSTPIVFAGMTGMAFTPQAGAYLHTLAWFDKIPEGKLILTLFGISWMLFEFGILIGNMIFTALINDVVPKEMIGRFYGLFRIVSLSVGIIFNAWFLGYAETHYLLLYLAVGGIYLTGFMLMCLKVKEGQYPPPPEQEKRRSALADAAVYLRESFSSSYYMLIFLAYTVGMVIFMPFNTYSVFFREQLNISLENFGLFTAASFGISIAISYPLGMLADRFHPLRCGIVITSVYAASSLASGIWVQGEAGFAAALIAHTVLSGAYFTLTASLLLRLFPQSRFAQYQSAQMILFTIVSSSMVPLVGKLIDIAGDYRLIFYAGALLSLLTAVLLYCCFVRFKRYGGDANYVAPEPESAG